MAEPAGELFNEAEALHKLMYQYHVPRRTAEVAIAEARADGVGSLPSKGLEVHFEYSAGGRFTIRGPGR